MGAATLTIILAAAGGVGMALQGPTNAMLARGVGSPITASLISFLVGSAALAAAVALSRARIEPAAVRALPWYVWIGGLYGAFFVAVAAYGAPLVGIGALLTAAVAGQMVAGVALDHVGALGLPKHPANLTRLIGAALVIAGAALVRRG